MTDSTSISTATNIIVQKTDPSCLEKTIQALELLNNNNNNNSKFPSSALAAIRCIPLAYMEPEGSKDFDNEEKAFLTVDPFNQYKPSFYISPHTNNCYSGKETNVSFCQNETQLYQKQQLEDDNSSSVDSSIQQELQTFQKAANEVWDSYRQLYYGFDDSVGSVFIKIKSGSGSEGKNNNNNNNNNVVTPVTLEAFFGIRKFNPQENARWDSVHLVTIGPPDMTTKTCDYRIDSAVWCSLQQSQGDTRQVIDAENLKPKTCTAAATTSTAATLVKETSRTNCKLMGILPPPLLLSGIGIPTAAHIENIGTMLEQIEMDFRSRLERVVMPKAVEVMQGIYREPGKSATVHLMEDDDADVGGDSNEENVNDNKTNQNKKATTGTGMGVGKDMIGDIVDSAKSKDGEKVLETVQQQRKEAVSSSVTNNAAAESDYTNMRASLKSPTITSPKAKVELSSLNGATPEFVNFRDKLKSPSKKK
jgi:hypothetical protein